MTYWGSSSAPHIIPIASAWHDHLKEICLVGKSGYCCEFTQNSKMMCTLTADTNKALHLQCTVQRLFDYVYLLGLVKKIDLSISTDFPLNVTIFIKSQNQSLNITIFFLFVATLLTLSTL